MQNDEMGENDEMVVEVLAIHDMLMVDNDEIEQMDDK